GPSRDGPVEQVAKGGQVTGGDVDRVLDTVVGRAGRHAGGRVVTVGGIDVEVGGLHILLGHAEAGERFHHGRNLGGVGGNHVRNVGAAGAHADGHIGDVGL